MNENALKNRRILIKNAEDGCIIAGTKIIRFDILTNSVHISVNSLADRKYYITRFWLIFLLRNVSMSFTARSG